jgi:flagellin-like hook-associated protein FlgL
MSINETSGTLNSYRVAIKNIGRRGQRLSTGQRYYNSGEGASQIAIANHHEQRIRSSQALLPDIHHAKGMTELQEVILNQANGALTRIMEIAALATCSTTLIPADYAAIHAEFSELIVTISDLATKANYSNQPVFSNSAVATNMKTNGAAITQTLDVGSLDLSSLAQNLAAYSLSNFGEATRTLDIICCSDPTGMTVALNTLQVKVGNNMSNLLREFELKCLEQTSHDTLKGELGETDLMEELSHNAREGLTLNSAMMALSQEQRYRDNMQNFISRMLG